MSLSTNPNFIPWFPFFEKMNLSDVFIVLHKCQFEKNGYQNRYKEGEKWVTNPVTNNVTNIEFKEYTSGHNLLQLNMKWIEVIKDTLDIKTPIIYEQYTEESSSDNLAVQVAMQDGTHYLTNFEAFDKYLKAEPFERLEIAIVPFKATEKRGIFEMFNIHGIMGCRKILKKQRKQFDALYK